MVSGFILMAIAISPAVSRMARSPHSAPVWAASFQFLDFRLLWVSILFYSVGNGMEQVSVGWLVFELTGSSFMVGVASAARMAPFFFLGILSGTLSDRLERRAFLRLVTLLAGGVAATMALLILATNASVWAVILLVAAQGSVFAFALTIRQAYTVDIIGSRQALNGLALTSISMQVGGIAGSLTSGVLIEALGPGWQYIAVAACYVASGLTLFAVRTPQRAIQRVRESVLQNLVGYIQLLRQKPQLADTDGTGVGYRGIRIHAHDTAAGVRQGRHWRGAGRPGDYDGGASGRGADRLGPAGEPERLPEEGPADVPGGRTVRSGADGLFHFGQPVCLPCGASCGQTLLLTRLIPYIKL